MKTKKNSTSGNRIALILLMLGIMLSALFMVRAKKLNYTTIAKELNNIFGKNMVLGVHDMGDGLIMSVVYIDGARKNEGTYSDAMVKARDFAYALSKYKEGEINEVVVDIGLKHSVEYSNIIASINIKPNKLKEIDWSSVNTLDELNKYIELNLQ